MPPVVVTATRTAQTQAEAIPHTTILSAEDIARAGASDVPSLLRREAGIQINRNGGLGSATGLFMRGAETRQTLVLIDGVPMTKQDATGVVSIEQIPLDQIERIEIVRGNVSAIYGSGAVGGVIQIFTKTGEGPARFNASAEAGSRGTARLAGGVRGSSGDTRYSVQISTLRTDGFSAINPAQRPAVNPDDDGYRNRSASGNVTQRLAADHSIGVRFLASKGEAEYDSAFGAPADIHTQTIRNNMLSVFSKNRFAPNWLSEVVTSRFNDKYRNTVPVSWSHTTTTQLQWNNTLQLTPHWTATAGYELRHEALKTSANLTPSRTVNALRGGVLGNVGSHQLQANLRHDRYSDVGNATTGYLGYGYAITDALKATASYSTAFSAAPLGYLFSPNWGNPNLRPEDTRAAEVGLQYVVSAGLLKAVLFKTETTDQFAFSGGQFRNVQRVENKGLELSYSGRVVATDLSASLTLQEPRDMQTGAIPIRRARTLASLGASRAFGAFIVGGDVLYNGRRDEWGQTLDAYTLVNLNARHQISKDLQLFGRIENVLDKTYQTAYTYNQPPRGLFVGLNWQH
jgi:vitamin B12 transporter